MRSWLKTLRVARGLTLKDVGTKLGISESYYCSIEAGTRQQNMDIMLAAGIASIFEIPVAEVIGYDRAWREEQKSEPGSVAGKK